MITELQRVKNLGIFRDFKWDGDLEDFCRFNLVYGWNGAGKTTLSRLFSALQEGTLPNYPELEYSVAAGARRWSQGSACDEKIRVFNRDYVLANVEKVGGPKPIFILGAENKEIVAQIAADETLLGAKLSEIERLEVERASLRKRKESLLTSVARAIGNTMAGESTRSYRRPNAEMDLATITEKELLDATALGAVQATLGQGQRDQLEEVSGFVDLDMSLAEIHEKSEKLLAQTVRAGVIERLEENNDIARWVEQGVSLHEEHGSDSCEFCREPITQVRLDELTSHFSDEDRALKQAIDGLSVELQHLETRLASLSVREAANLYEELAPNYQRAVDCLLPSRTALAEQIEAFKKEIGEKKAHTTEVLHLAEVPSAVSFLTAIDDLNAVIKEHNIKARDFEQAKTSAREKLKRHFLSEILDEARQIEAESDTVVAKVTALRDGNPTEVGDHSVSDLKIRLASARAKISSSHAACKAISEQLALFLGREELSFEVSGEGYEIKRFGEPATDLSESERTAVAFVYFVVQLGDRDFDLANGIVVIDDPISSLDSNSLFQAFAFLKSSVKDARQVFILTHNFEFMRQVKNWFYHIKKAGGRPQRSFYMIKNREAEGRREAFVAPLDKLLLQFESEYHYLFKLLHDFSGDGSLEAIYNFPNVGRKFLETFLAFKVPSHENIHQKMGRIEYEESKKTAILRFVETHSHAERSDGVLNFDMSLIRGGQTAINDLLNMVETIDATHYETLLAAVGR